VVDQGRADPVSGAHGRHAHLVDVRAAVEDRAEQEGEREIVIAACNV
jgi:glycine cleavage system protein P-like pyridoxal-binding family